MNNVNVGSAVICKPYNSESTKNELNYSVLESSRDDLQKCIYTLKIQ